MQRFISLIFCLIGWFALVMQYVLMIKNSMESFWETSIRFFSFFTILTNLIVAIYFTYQALQKKSLKNEHSGMLTAITLYIAIVGLVYQVILRSTWNPIGLQKLADELLHSIIPLLTLLYWYLYENKKNLQYRLIVQWALYPLGYLFLILIRGQISNFYPYSFVNVTELGFSKVLINSCWISVLFIGLSLLLIRIGKLLNR